MEKVTLSKIVGSAIVSFLGEKLILMRSRIFHPTLIVLTLVIAIPALRLANYPTFDGSILRSWNQSFLSMTRS